MELDDLLAQYEEIHKNAKKVEVAIPLAEVSKTFDDAPEDLINLEYSDLLNMYKKIQKIIEIKQKFQTYEVPERRVSIEMAEKPEKPAGRIVEEMPVARPLPPPPPPQKPVELPPPPKPAEVPPPPPVPAPEKKEEVLKLPEEKIKKHEGLIFPKGEEMEEEEEKKLEVAVPYIHSHEEIIIEMPKQLSVPVDEAAKKKIESVLKRYQQAGEINKSDLKRRMIELTRELFKEKSAERKAELKAEIVELKKMIEQKEAEKRGEGVFEALMKEQDEELNEVLSGLLGTFNTNFDKVNNEYQQAKLVIFEDPSLTAKADSLFLSDLDSILSQMTRIIDAYLDYIVKVHVAELEHLKGFGGVDAESINKRVEYVRLNYPSRFDELKKSIHSTINKAKPSAKPATPAPAREERVVSAPPVERPGPSAPPAEKKEEALEGKDVLDEISRMHEGELLHYLSARDRRIFVSYVRGEISKEEAVRQARILLAKERGVSDTLIKTYWG
ncbi:MAG: hypothetical protein QXL47_00420 [Candidatus Anstonellales archaeon]